MHVLIAALHRPSKPTGVCRHAANLAQCLAETAQVTHVTLVVGAWQQKYFETSFVLSSAKIHLVSVDIKNTAISRNRWFLLGLPKLANSLYPDIVHLSFPMPFFRALFASPVVTTVHDLYPYECPENFGYPQVLFNQLFLKQCINQSDGLSCVSQVTLKQLEVYFSGISLRKQTTVVYNSVDFSDVSPTIPKALESNTSFPFLLCVAQHRKNKNLDLLIQAYAALLSQYKLQESSKLIIVGSPGPETDNLWHQINMRSLQDQVLMLSSINDGELRWLYQHCESFIIASSTEGFCLPLAEALHLSCRVVCSDIPILKEIGSSACTYFDLNGDPVKNLVQAIAHTLAKPNGEEISKDSRFTRLVTADQYLKFYKAVQQAIYLRPVN